MITKELFREQCKLMQQLDDVYNTLHDIRIDMLESPLYSIPSNLFENWTKTIGKEELQDLVYWWLYEDVDKIIWEGEKEIRIDTIDDLYDYLETNDLFIK